MAHSGGIILYTVDMPADINAVLGKSHTDLRAFCTDPDVNKFAKFKPVINTTIDTVTGQWDYVNDRWIDRGDGTNWWVADGKCGLSFDTFSEIGILTNTNSFLYKLANGLLPWQYRQPQGGAQQPFRLTDFANYFHDAVPPVGALAGAGGTIYVPTSGQGTRLLSLNYESPAQPDYNLTLADFYINGVRLSNYYLAVVLIKGTRWIVASSINTIGSVGSTVIETEIGYSDIGTWQVIPFISSVNINAQGQQQQGVYMSAGYDTPDTINIAPSSTIEQIAASGVYTNAAKTQVGFHVTLYNDGSSQVTHANGLTVYVYQTNESAISGEGGDLVAQWQYNSSVSVPANGSYTLPENTYIAALDDYVCGTVNVPAPPSGKIYWVTARYNDGTSLQNSWEQVEEAIMPI